MALVVGNGAYAEVARLPNPPNDARRMETMLRERMGFEVVRINDGKLRDLDAALERFSRMAQGAEVALFFYAGHGMEHDGQNRLVPVDAVLEQERDVERQTLALDQVMKAMRGARVRVLLLDACRNNPLAGRMVRSAGGMRSGEQGLAPVQDAGPGTVIAFATAPGRVASDGAGSNSPFTLALLEKLPQAGEDIRVVLGDVSDSVESATGGRQSPWTNFTGLRGRFLLVPPVAAPAPAQQLAAAQSSPPPPALPSGYPVPVGETFRDCADCPELVVIPAGWFNMGSYSDEPERHDDEGPLHAVTVRAPLAVGKYEVTFAEWDACVAADGCGGYRPEDQGWGRGRRPVVNVSWEDAQGYVRWLSGRTGQPYRLLTEAEWEYAARAGTTTPYAVGLWITPWQANYSASGLGRTQEVGRYPANRWGLHDMQGNVWEWVTDRLRGSYAGAPTDASMPVTGGDSTSHMLRGGSWDSTPKFLRSASRGRGALGDRVNSLGFRVARTPG